MIFDIAIVGSGLVGLAVAHHIKKRFPDQSLVILEKEDGVAAHQTGHNSGVIHSGIYYKPNSLKATNCIDGYNKLISFSDQHGIPYELCGKVIVATTKEEEERLESIFKRGQQNGLTDLRLIGREELTEIEPHVAGTKAIRVPQTGIISYKSVADKLRELLEAAGAEFIYSNPIKTVSFRDNRYYLEGPTQKVEARFMINCAGLYSDKIAKAAGLKLDAKVVPFRGEYYLLKDDKKHLVKNLIYPVPNPAFPFLGVHFTRRITGEIDAGPSAVLAFAREGYTNTQVNFSELVETLTYSGFRKIAFKYWDTGLGEMKRSFFKGAYVKELKKLIPEIKSEDLVTGPSGVRAQLCDKNGELVDDFKFVDDVQAIHVLNAPSPAATSSLQIGETVCQRYEKMLS